MRHFRRPALAQAAARAATLWPGRLRGARTDDGYLERIASAAELRGLALDSPPEHAQRITALRDEASLRWRYFESPDATRALFRYRWPHAGSRSSIAMRPT